MNVSLDLLILVAVSTVYQSTCAKQCMSSHDLVHEMVCKSEATMRDILPCGAKRLKVTSQSDGTAISCGAVIDKDLMTTIPLIQMPDQVKLTDGNYVVMILNRDDPSRDNPKNRYWVHLLIANVSVRYLETGSDTTGAFTLTEYAAPTPTANSGPHRYQIFVLKQSTVAGEDMSGQPSYRKGFRAHAFASINKLCNNGSLVGAFEYILRG